MLKAAVETDRAQPGIAPQTGKKGTSTSAIVANANAAYAECATPGVVAYSARFGSVMPTHSRKRESPMLNGEVFKVAAKTGTDRL